MSITALHEQAQAEVQEFSDSEDDGAVVVALPRMPRPEKIDIKSCEQFLLELFQQWMSPYIQPRTSLMLLTDATKAVSTKSPSRLCERWSGWSADGARSPNHAFPGGFSFGEATPTHYAIQPHLTSCAEFFICRNKWHLFSSEGFF